ncbi:CAP domain-containing protein [Actimicrobium sp. CCI2.3]|uniref:CAP domain-containing protein n=1 Tax=Actimicrobium sp. CCI2.3 TaxID=3048616 RepID=UPI002AB5CF48|nr:CAP domain-containing protein [Actimicrobium sp. CCI2.3]MDY7576566.1 CAP domain-containing protein [Actimicrobium sp. CCI2.3]MEB0021167.1 CAP domain-containing protein [Actimicrobium sp. CCI2.3]
MTQSRRIAACASALSLLFFLTACGGGNNASAPAPAGDTTTQLLAEPGTPTLTNDTATDGYNRLNFRRQQMGLGVLTRNANVDLAARGHSNYQKVNDKITHVQVAGKPGFTGVGVAERLTAANYVFTSTRGYAFGEVIAASANLAGATNVEDLITAIYHRFVIFEPKFLEAGAGSDGFSATGYNFLTVNFTANGLGPGLGKGKFAVYPSANQTGVTTVFYSDQELPDPVPNQNAVGYPVSVHADIDAVVTVQTFTISPRGGQALATRLLINSTDPETPSSAAAIIPSAELSAATTYDVKFVGTVSGLAADRIWSFTTR